MQLAKFSQRPVAGEVDAVLEIRSVASLRASLVHAPQPMKRIGETAALGDRHRAGLLAIDVLSGLRGHDGQQRVPAIARGDQDGIDVLPLPQVVHVGVHLAVAVAVMPVDLGLDLFPPLVASIADRPELHVVVGEE